MKKILVSGLLIVALSAMVYAGSRDRTGSGKKKCGSSKGYCKLMKDVKIDVTNTDDGVTVKVTSDDPEVVKLIQECWAKKQKGLCGKNKGSASKEGSPKCDKKSLCGKCPVKK